LEFGGETVGIAADLFDEKRSHMRNESFQPSALIVDSSDQKKKGEEERPL